MWPETEKLAEDGLVAFACTSYKPAVAPAGAIKPLFGTNPISFAWPRHGKTPVVYDMATASMAMGEVQVAKREGHKVPLGTGLTKDGKETTDPGQIADGGVLLPFGGYKGSAIAMMVELLAGALVGNLQREAGKFIQEAEGEVSVIAVGRKGERFITRTGGDLLAGFSVPDRPVMDDTVTVGRMLVEEYRSERVDRVVLIYAQFISTAVQEVTIRQLLPVEPAQRGEGDVQKLHQLDYIYEPSISSVLQSLVPRYIETQVYHGILEAFASEHSARMIAMQNATDNAQEIVETGA